MAKPVLVLKPHSYAQAARAPGEVYLAADRDIAILEKSGLVTAKVPPAGPDPWDEPSFEPEKRTPKKRKPTYRRRDMEAEDACGSSPR